MIKNLRCMILSLLLALPAVAGADELDALRSKLATLIPGQTADSINLSALPGVYEVVYGVDVFYITKDGQHLLQGDLIDLDGHNNITESTRALVRLKALSGINEDTMIVFAPKEVKHTLTVFTDIDCGYCRKLHGEMAELNKLGIKVRYLAFPRSGVDTPSYYKAVTVWCSKDRNQAMTHAKSDENLPQLTCENPVKQHLDVVKKLGIRGTPALILEDGQLVSGYVPAAELLKLLDQHKKI
ncbi:MAG: thioredoxin fold domain-containing protein [Gammaproteobacteria bacterium]